MSDINPDFSFPSPSPHSAPAFPPAPIHSNRPLSFSPQSRPRKHAHRRSAAMSEDLSAVELATLTTPQMPTPTSFTKTESPGTFNSGSITPLPMGTPVSSDETSPSRDSFDSRSHVQFISSPLPKRQHQIGEPGQLIAKPSSSPPLLTSSPISRSDSLASPCEDHEKTEKRRKRRSFVQLFKKSGDVESVSPSASLNNMSTSVSPSQSPTGDDTLVAPAQLQPPSSSLRTPVTQQTPQFSGSPVTTPRSSGELARDVQPMPPTIDLDEALSCSFTHRKPDPLLESPFSKSSSAMGAVLEEEENEGADSESDSLNSVPRQRQRPASFLQKSNSVCSNASSIRLKPPLSPRFVPNSQNSYSAGYTGGYTNNYSGGNSSGGSRTISYVGPILQPPSPRASPPRSPRLSFEQVSNLAILDPKPAMPPPPSKHLSMPPTQSPSNKKTHHRRRSLIDRLMRR